MLLAIFDPRIPRVGGTRSIAVKSMEVSLIHPLYFLCLSAIAHYVQEQIKPNLRELCGIGLYNRWTPPGIFTASMGIAICKYFKHR
jgi:hypothetical protein